MPRPVRSSLGYPPPTMSIIVFQHSDKCRPGRLGVTLRDHAFDLDIRRIDEGDDVPPDLDDVDAVIALGGPQNVGEQRWMQREMDFLRLAHEHNLPVIGICLGAQLLAAALGGRVEAMQAMEIGMVDVSLTEHGQTDIIHAGVPWMCPAFEKHKQHVAELPPGATLLASSEQCTVQAFRAGMRTYGFQHHLECDRSMIDGLMADARLELHSVGLTTDEFAKQLDADYERFSRMADRICLNIATFLIPRVANAVRI